MRIALVHGYFLGDSGSGIYVRELARQFVKDGHEVTLVCQEKSPELYDFVDTFYVLEEDNRGIRKIFSRDAIHTGSCRLVRPNIHGNLLTYVASSDRSFNNETFQTAGTALIRSYLEDNIEALKTVFTEWPPEIIQTNHAIMQPYEVAEALRLLGKRIPYCVTIHGSALNFSVKTDPRLVRFFLEGLKEASGVVALSDESARDVIGYSGKAGYDVSTKTRVIPPGVDTDLFKPDAAALSPGSIATAAVIAGRLLWTKGTHYAIAAMPLITQSERDFHLILAGDGPMEQPLRELIRRLDDGDLKGARELLATEGELIESPEYGPVIPRFGWDEEAFYIKAAAGNTRGRVRFLGHLTHGELAPVLAGADLTIMASVFSEAYGLSAVEGLSCGALPVATYQSGLKTPLEIIEGKLKDPIVKSMVPGIGLTRALADSVTHILDRYPTKDISFREDLHRLAEKRFSWARAAETYIMLFKE